MVDIVSNFQQGLAFGQQQRAQKQAQQDKQQLRNLAPAILQGDPEAYSQAAVIDPQAAQTYQDAGDRDYRRLTNVIGIMQKAIDSDNPVAKQTAFRTITPYLKQLTGGRPVPEQWDDSLLPGFEQLKQRVQMASQSAPGGGAKVVGNSLVDASGNVLYREPVRGVPINVADGKGGQIQMIFDPETRQISPPSYMVNGPQGKYAVEAGNPELAAIAAADQAAGGVDQVTLPPQDVGAARFGYTPPKPDMTPAEARRLQLQEAANARADQAAELARRASYRADRAEARQEQANSVGGRPPSEGERNASGFYQRMTNASKEMQALESQGYDPTNLRDYATVGNAALNFAASEKGQQYHQAAMNWVRANLRKESGAAIGKDEAESEIRNYFPQPGDSPAVIQQKARNRQVTEEAMRQAAGRAVQGQPQQSRTVVRRGTANGRPVVQYSDGTIDYAD